MRKTKMFVVTDDNRDKGKAYLLTEMSAVAAEEWGARAFQGLARAGVTIPDNMQGIGVAGLMTLGFEALAGMPFGDLKSLMDELMACVQIIPDRQHPNVVRAADAESDIEEVKTRVQLKREVFELVTGFTFAAARSDQSSGTATKSAA